MTCRAGGRNVNGHVPCQRRVEENSHTCKEYLLVVYLQQNARKNTILKIINN